MEERICEWCGDAYSPTLSQQKYCSVECGMMGIRYRPIRIFKCKLCGNEFASQNKSEYCSKTCIARSRYAKAQPKQRVCEACGKSYLAKSDKRRFCSQECINKLRPEKKRYTCEYCGKRFTTKNSHARRYCSAECRVAARPKIPVRSPMIFTKVCVVCNLEFKTVIAKQLICSTKCSSEYARVRSRKIAQSSYMPRRFICKECSREILTEYGNKHGVFCSEQCQNKYFSRLYKAKRRIQISNAFTEAVDFGSIYERDKGICQICGQKVAYDTTPSNAYAATVDHIIPLSIGGEHSMSNCQLAHRICNSFKLQSGREYKLLCTPKPKRLALDSKNL